jgi:integrase
MKYLRALNGNLEEMTKQLLSSSWCDKSKECAINAIAQYAKFQNVAYIRPAFKGYDNKEMYVPSPEMVRQFIYRVRSPHTKALIMLAIETGGSAGEIFNLKWKDANLAGKTVTITGIKGHRTTSYNISNDLLTVLMQLPRVNDRIFSQVSKVVSINDNVIDYRQRLAKETGNTDFLKIHFHTFRHYAISWHYFKTKDIVATQRFARHCNIQNTLKYVHLIKAWVKDNQYDVVYAESKEELTKYLSEGYQLVTKTDWGYCLNRPKSIA